MKRFFSGLLAAALLLSLTACGSSTAASSGVSSALASSGAENTAPAAPAESVLESTTESSQAGSEQEAGEMVTSTMVYFLDLGDGSIMAAPIDDTGTDLLGGDYLKVFIENAEITDADGNSMTLDQMERGCVMDVTFPGMVTMSIPAQISATKIVVTNNTPDPDFPDEHDIPDLFGTGKWWEPEVVNQAPDLVVQYSDDLGQYSQMIPYKTGTWSYGDESTREGGVSNARLDGQKPQEWVFDEYSTVKKTTFDTVKLVFAPPAASMTVMAYHQDDPSDAGTELTISENGEISLLEEDNIVYVVSAQWDSEQYSGSAVYGFLVTRQQ